MALYLNYRPSQTASSRPRQWNINDPVSTKYAVARDAPYLEHIQADGDELAYIQQRFRGCIPNPEVIPSTYVRRYIGSSLAEHLNDEPKVVRWFGEMAKFIAANL